MKKGLRVVAMITLVCFLTTQSVWGAPGAGIEIASPHEMPTALSIDVPAELGTVDALYEAPGAAHPQFILHIQNAHANYHAQMKIKQLLEHMNRKYGFKTIFVEGAAEKLNPDYLKLFPEPKDNEAFCDSLAKQGELTGAEMFLMEESVSGKASSVEGLGIEKTALYRSNYEALKKVFGAETDVNRFFVGFDSKLDRVASKTFTPETRQLIADWKRFEQGRREFMPFVRDLARKSKKILSIDLESLFAQVSWPQISRLLVIQQMEKDLDRTKGIEEKKKLIESLRSQNISKELMGALESFNEGSISIGKSSQEVLPRQLMENLAGEAGPKGFKFSDYPAFSLFAGYVILRSELDPKALFEEIEYLFTRVLDTLAPEPQQKALLALYRDGELLRKLLRLELSRAQWRQLVERKAQVAVPTIVTRLRDAVVASGDTSIQQGQEVMPPAFKEKMMGLFNAGLEFYDFARQREGAFYQEIRSAMAERKITKAVLITGGFHTDGMSDIFRENSISYGIVTPRLSEKSNEKMYRGIMLGKHPGDFDVSYLEAVVAMQSPQIQFDQQGFADISAILNEFMSKTGIMDRAKAVEVFKTTQAYQALRMGDPAKGSLGFDVVQKKTRDGKPAVDELGRPLFGLEKLTATPEGQAAPSVVPSVAPAKRSESFLGDLMTQRGITLEKWNSAKKLSVWDPDDPDAWVLLVEDDSIRGKILTAGLESVYGKGKVVLARTVDDGLDEIASRASQPYRMILDNTLVGSSLSGQEFVQGLFDEGYETAVVMQTSESTDVKTALSATLKEKTPEVLSKTDFDRMLKAGFPPFLEILGLPSKAEDRAAVRTAPGGISALAKILAVIASLVPGLVKGAPMAETNAPAPAAVTAPVEPGTFTNITSGLRVELMPTGGVERPSFSLGTAATGVVQTVGVTNAVIPSTTFYEAYPGEQYIGVVFTVDPNASEPVGGFDCEILTTSDLAKPWEVSGSFTYQEPNGIPNGETRAVTLFQTSTEKNHYIRIRATGIPLARAESRGLMALSRVLAPVVLAGLAGVADLVRAGTNVAWAVMATPKNSQAFNYEFSDDPSRATYFDALNQKAVADMARIGKTGISATSMTPTNNVLQYRVPQGFEYLKGKDVVAELMAQKYGVFDARQAAAGAFDEQVSPAQAKDASVLFFKPKMNDAITDIVSRAAREMFHPADQVLFDDQGKIAAFPMRTAEGARFVVLNAETGEVVGNVAVEGPLKGSTITILTNDQNEAVQANFMSIGNKRVSVKIPSTAKEIPLAPRARSESRTEPMFVSPMVYGVAFSNYVTRTLIPDFGEMRAGVTTQKEMILYAQKSPEFRRLIRSKADELQRIIDKDPSWAPSFAARLLEIAGRSESRVLNSEKAVNALISRLYTQLKVLGLGGVEFGVLKNGSKTIGLSALFYRRGDKSMVTSIGMKNVLGAQIGTNGILYVLNYSSGSSSSAQGKPVITPVDLAAPPAMSFGATTPYRLDNSSSNLSAEDLRAQAPDVYAAFVAQGLIEATAVASSGAVRRSESRFPFIQGALDFLDAVRARYHSRRYAASGSIERVSERRMSEEALIKIAREKPGVLGAVLAEDLAENNRMAAVLTTMQMLYQKLGVESARVAAIAKPMLYAATDILDKGGRPSSPLSMANAGILGNVLMAAFKAEGQSAVSRDRTLTVAKSKLVKAFDRLTALAPSELVFLDLVLNEDREAIKVQMRRALGSSEDMSKAILSVPGQFIESIGPNDFERNWNSVYQEVRADLDRQRGGGVTRSDSRMTQAVTEKDEIRKYYGNGEYADQLLALRVDDEMDQATRQDVLGSEQGMTLLKGRLTSLSTEMKKKGAISDTAARVASRLLERLNTSDVSQADVGLAIAAVALLEIVDSDYVKPDVRQKSNGFLERLTLDTLEATRAYMCPALAYAKTTREGEVVAASRNAFLMVVRNDKGDLIGQAAIVSAGDLRSQIWSKRPAGEIRHSVLTRDLLQRKLGKEAFEKLSEIEIQAQLKADAETLAPEFANLPLQDSDMLMFHIVVRTDSRRQGVGKQLNDDAIRHIFAMNEALPEAQRTKVLRGTTAMNLKSVLMDTPLGKLVLGRQLTANYNEVQSDEIYTYALVLNPIARADSRMMVPVREIDEMLKYYGSGSASELLVLRKDAEKYQAKRQKVLGSEQWMTLLETVGEKAKGVGYEDPAIKTAQDVLKRLATSEYAEEMAVLLNQIAKRTVIAMPTQPDTWGLAEWQLILEAVDHRDETFNIPGKDRSFAGPESRLLEDPASRVWDGLDFSLRGLKLSDLRLALEMFNVMGAKAQLMTFIADKGRSVGYKDSSIETAQDVLKRLSTSAYAKEMAVLLNQIAKRTVIAMPTQPDAWGLDEWQLILEAVDRRNEIFRIPGKDRSFAGAESRSLEDPASRVWDGDVDSSDSSLRGLKLSDLWTAREIVHVVGFDPSSIHMDLDQLMSTVQGFAQGVRADLESESEFTWPSFYKRLDAIETQLSRPALMYWLFGRLGKMDGQPLNAEEKQEFLINLRFAPAVLGALKKGLDRDRIVEDYGADLSFVKRTMAMIARAESRVVPQAGEVEKRITVAEKQAAVAAVLKDANLKDSARKTLENTSTAALEKMLPGIQGRPEFSLLSSEEKVALALTWGIASAENLAASIGLLGQIAGLVSSGTAEGLLERVRAAAPNAVVDVSSEKCVVATVISEIGDVAEFSRGLKLVFLLNPNARLLFLDTGDPAEQQKADQVKAIISAWGKGINNEKIAEQIRFDFSPMGSTIDQKAVAAFARKASNAGEKGETGFVLAADEGFLSKLDMVMSGTPVALAYTKDKKSDAAARVLLARAAQLLRTSDAMVSAVSILQKHIPNIGIEGGMVSITNSTLLSALANLSQIMAAFESIDKAA